MAHIELRPFVYDCTVCHTHCDGISKAVYRFENDTAFSERFEQMIIDKIKAVKNFAAAAKCTEPGYPDIVVRNEDGTIRHYVEVKVQQRTFMLVKKILPHSLLQPSETVALNLSDLKRYFAIQDQTKIPVSIVWVVLHRPCIIDENSCRFFIQTLDKLKTIYEAYGDKRRFRRRSGEGDVVAGVHKGVTVNYHFSLTELRPWYSEKLE